MPVPQPTVLTRIDRQPWGKVAHVTLYRPGKKNSLTLETLSELIDAGRMLRRERELRAVIISGHDGTFCSGLDFADTLSRPSRIVAAFIPRPMRSTNLFQEACWIWRRLPVPVIAVVEGHCLGGGLQIALAADFRITTADAKWSVLEAKWGLIPDMTGMQTLSELAGLDQAKKWVMTGETLSGLAAAEAGLALECTDEPHGAALALAAKIAERSPDSVAATKRLLGRSWNRGPAQTFALERMEQLLLLASKNSAIARKSAFKGEAARFVARKLR